MKSICEIGIKSMFDLAHTCDHYEIVFVSILMTKSLVKAFHSSCFSYL